MAVRQYIGARYVPIFGRKGEDSILWDNTGTYEPLTVVLYQGNSYTSRQFVPVGVDINNENYWAETGNYNAQIEQYRQEVLGFDDRISDNSDAIDVLENQLAGTASSGLKDAIDENAGDIDTLNDQMAGTVTSGLKSAIDSLSESTTQAIDNINDNLDDLSDSLDEEVSKREESDSKISTLELLTSRLVLGGTLMPSYVGSYEGDEQHASCVRVGNEIYTFSPNNYDGMGTARIWSLTGNSLVTSKQILMGHGNSVAYDTVRDCIWIAPMNIYTSGTSTQTMSLYRYNLALSSRVEITAPERIYGVSFDPTSDTLYCFNTVNGTNQIRVFSMGPSDSSLSLIATITNDIFAERGPNDDALWQDFAVYDGKAIFSKWEGTCYIVDLNAENPDIDGTVRVSHYDAGGIWEYAELEGMEFDVNGRLYATWQCDCGFTNAGKNYHRSVGFVTELNTAKNASPQNCAKLQLYGSISLQPATTFGVLRYGAHSLNELLWRIDNSWSVVVVPSSLTHTIERAKITKDMCLRVDGTLIVNNYIEHISGSFFFYINGGNVTFNTPSDETCLQVATRSTMLSFRCKGGSMNLTNTDKFISTGYAPALIVLGAMDNIESVKINGNARSELTLSMGSYVIWSH